MEESAGVRIVGNRAACLYSRQRLQHGEFTWRFFAHHGHGAIAAVGAQRPRPVSDRMRSHRLFCQLPRWLATLPVVESTIAIF